MDLHRRLSGASLVVISWVVCAHAAAQAPEPVPEQAAQEGATPPPAGEQVVAPAVHPLAASTSLRALERDDVSSLSVNETLCYAALEYAQLLETAQAARDAGHDTPEGDYCRLWIAVVHDAAVNGDSTALADVQARMSADAPRTGALVSEAVEELARPTPDSGGAQGTASQTTPVPSAIPVDRTSLSTAYANADGADYLVATVALNPGTAFAGNNPDLWTARFMDVSVTAPFLVSDEERDTVDAFAVNARVNFASLFDRGASDFQMRTQIRAALRARLASRVVAEQALYAALEGYVASLGDLEGRAANDALACLRRVVDGEYDCIVGLIDVVERAQAYRDSFDDIVREERNKLERFYLGIDFRLLVGDPTLSGMLPDDGTTILASVAAGIRVPRTGKLKLEFRARAGYTGTRSEGFMRRGVDFALGMEAMYPFSDSRCFRFGLGAEGSYDGEKNDGDAVVDGTNLRVGLSMPLTTDTSFDLGLSWPIGDTTRVPIFTISTRVSDLFSGLRERD